MADKKKTADEREVSRRRFLQSTAGGVALTAGAGALGWTGCSDDDKPKGDSGGGTKSKLRIMQWAHFVPLYDRWFDPFAQDWGSENNVDVEIQHVPLKDLLATANAALVADDPPDLIEYISTPADKELLSQDLSDVVAELETRYGKMVGQSRNSCYNPKTSTFYGLSHGWVPDLGNLRRSLWEKIGKPEGPKSWQDLLDGGRQIKQEQGIPVGIGLAAADLDANMNLRALLYSYGASVQDADTNVVINSAETLQAVEFMTQLYKDTMTEEMLNWTATSNNDALLQGKASYILNSISAYRAAQKTVPNIARDVFFVSPLEGPKTALNAQHVVYVYLVPKKAKNANAAKDFLMHLCGNYSQAVFNSELYNLPAFLQTTPQLTEENSWFDVDPFNATPPDKLKLLKESPSWSTVVGHPGATNAAVGEVFDTGILATMMSKAVTGEMQPQAAVDWAEVQVNAVFDKWRKEGLI